MSNYSLWEKVSRFYYVEIYEVRNFCEREAFLNPIVLLSILTDRLIEVSTVAELLEKNRIAINIGTQGFGKTDFSLKLYEEWKKRNPDGILVTNVKSVDTEKRYVTGDVELKKVLTGEDREKFVLLDEGAKILSLYTSAFAKKTQVWLEYANDVRKYRSVFVFCSPLFAIMFKGIRRFIRIVIQKLSLRTGAVWLSYELFPYLVTDIPATKIKFDTQEIAVWSQKRKRET